MDVDEPDRRTTPTRRDLAFPTSRFTVLAGVEVHHEVRGPERAPAVLLSHHFFGSTAAWHRVMAGLEDRYRAIAFDRPGFGLTERPSRNSWNGENPYTRAFGAKLGWALLDHLEVDEAVLVGSSAGGTNVLEMYRLHPERVRGLVLLSAAITGDVGPPPQLRPLLRSPSLRVLGPALAARFAGEITAERVGRSWHDPSKVTDEHVAPYRRLLEVEGWDRGFWELATAEAPPDLRDVLAAVTVPTLVVAGASDRVISPAANRRTAAAIAGARLEVLEACGHTPQEECPDRVVSLLEGFLASLPPSATASGD